MRIISSDEIDACLEDRPVLETLRQAYRSGAIAPAAAPLEVARPGGLAGAFRLQPAWTDFAAQGDTRRGYIGCALTLDLPEQAGAGSGLYLLFSGTAGQPVALIDGMRMALWRDAGLTALAAGYLAREDATRLLVIGDDPRLPRLVSAYAGIRNLTSILCAGCPPETLKRLAGLPTLRGVHIGATADIAEAQDGADMICVARTQGLPDLRLALERLDPPAGCHIDVLDATAPLPEELLREARLFTSDLAEPPTAGQAADGIEWAADLKELSRGDKAGRRYYGQRTLFWPGPRTGLADFALAAHVFLRT